MTFEAAIDKTQSAGVTTISKGGITITMAKGTNTTTGVLNNGSNYRCYKGNTLTISSDNQKNIKKIVFTCTASNTEQYGPGCFTTEDGTYTFANKTGTWTGNKTAVKFTASTNQVRMTKIEITIEGTAEPTFSFSATEATATLGEEFTAPKLTNTYEGDVKYSSSDEAVAKVDETTGDVTPLSAGEATITAKLVSGDNVTASYTLTVKAAGIKTMTLSMNPTSGEYPTAQNVTLTSSVDGAKIYYTTDNTEPTTESEVYTTDISVTKSGTTIKAIAMADGYENATAEATYTIKPEQPIFSAESKTFQKPFDVTLALPATASEKSTIHYAIGKTATADSPVYDGTPITVNGENDGDKIILHAVVVDEYGNVGKEKYCTYTYTISTGIVFDFTANPNVWGITPTTDNNTSNTDSKKLKVDDVILTTTSGTGAKTCIFGTSPTLRLYAGSTITLTAPANYEIVSIKFTGSGSLQENGTTTTIYVANGQWKDSKESVTFERGTSNCQIKTITVTLKEKEIVPTSATLNFVAYNNDGYYATFNSDKDVVFTDDVVVYTVNVEGTAAKLNALDEDIYEVTDAAAGDDNDGSLIGYYVPKNTGVLINCMDETTNYYFPKEETAVELPANMLEPATADEVFTGEEGYKYYKLAYNDYAGKTDLGFYWGADDGGAFKVKKGLAYLAVPPTSNAAPARFIFGGDTTDINNVETDVNTKETVIYNIAGQRVKNLGKAGIYIVNGKKLLVK